MSAFEIYIIMSLDSISNSMVGLPILAIAVSAVYCCFKYNDTIQTWKDVAETCKKAWTICFVLLVIGAFIPSSKTAALMYLLPKITSSETAKMLHEQSPEIARLVISILKGEQ